MSHAARVTAARDSCLVTRDSCQVTRDVPMVTSREESDRVEDSIENLIAELEVEMENVVNREPRNPACFNREYKSTTTSHQNGYETVEPDSSLSSLSEQQNPAPRQSYTTQKPAVPSRSPTSESAAKPPSNDLSSTSPNYENLRHFQAPSFPKRSCKTIPRSVSTKKEEIHPIPRTNLFVFKGRVVSLQKIIDDLHSANPDSVEDQQETEPISMKGPPESAAVNIRRYSKLPPSNLVSSLTGNGSMTSQNKKAKSRDSSHIIPSERDPMRTLVLAADKLKSELSNKPRGSFKLETYDSLEDVPKSRRVNGTRLFAKLHSNGKTSVPNGLPPKLTSFKSSDHSARTASNVISTPTTGPVPSSNGISVSTDVIVTSHAIPGDDVILTSHAISVEVMTSLAGDRQLSCFLDDLDITLDGKDG